MDEVERIVRMGSTSSERSTTELATELRSEIARLRAEARAEGYRAGVEAAAKLLRPALVYDRAALIVAVRAAVSLADSQIDSGVKFEDELAYLRGERSDDPFLAPPAPARLDADRAAQPLTEIRGVVDKPAGRDGATVVHNPDAYVFRDKPAPATARSEE